MTDIFTDRVRCVMFLAFSLSACGAADTGARPAVEIRTVVQRVEVPVPCPVKKPERPAKLARPLPTDSIGALALVTAKLLELTGPGGYVDRADAALDTCLKAAQP